MQDILEASAAHVDGEPCVTYLGPHSAGHYVKMVHNGIEYGIMQLIAETYDLLSRGLGLTDDELGEVFSSWNQAELNGYLVEITADIFRKVDEITGKRLVDVVLDAAHQLGTGMWTSQDALALHVPTPTIDSCSGHAQPVGFGRPTHGHQPEIWGPDTTPDRREEARSSNKPGVGCMPPPS